MKFIIAVGIIFVISIALSIISLFGAENKSHLDNLKKKLFKKRIVFQDPSLKE